MCGGDLEVKEGMKVVECEYCGTSQTVPEADSEKKMNLFNRANRLRLSNEFDKAAGVFESIVAEFPKEAEAYWGLCLCKYGIEYVDDAATAKKIPTCHRTSYESIFDDGNYKLTLEYADSVAADTYRAEAKEIDSLQKSILEIVSREEPFDVFICYKETEENGQRTKDSVLAQDIYDALIAKGYKVFFARITLEDKLGQEYEPYIFSALNSAKVMLAIGTTYDHYNAVWVKNEWSRFLDLMKKDKKKVLIPCYADMDAYDMPPEFKNLQGQDMGKVGFLQDIIRGIGKIIPLSKTVPSQQIQQVIVPNSNIENLLKRGNMALADKKWDDAEKFFERVLDENAEEARAYFGKMLAEYHLSNAVELSNFDSEISGSINYKNAWEFGDEDLRKQLKKISNNCQEKNVLRLYKSNDIEDIWKAVEIILKGIEWGDSKEWIAKCEEKIKKREELIERIKEQRNHTIAVSGNAVVGILANGRIKTFTSPGKSDIASIVDWWGEGIIALASSKSHMIGLKKNGTVMTTDKVKLYQKDEEGKEKLREIEKIRQDCIIQNWENMVSIAAGENHNVGLRADGTVISDKYDVSFWKGIIAIAAGANHVVGLKLDGTVLAEGENKNGQCDVSKWEGIIAVSAGENYTIGLKEDGSVEATGDNSNGACNVHEWRDIVAIYAGEYTVGLCANGKYEISDTNNITQPLVPLIYRYIASPFETKVYVSLAERLELGLKDGFYKVNLSAKKVIDIAFGSKGAIALVTDVDDNIVPVYKIIYNWDTYVEAKPYRMFTGMNDIDASEKIIVTNDSMRKTGCYIATCVYGSYDCPQVWTLRRFRDNTLASTWYGRSFVKLYYAISPSLVKWFGNTNIFKKVCRKPLEYLVDRLHKKGVSDKPYNDKPW